MGVTHVLARRRPSHEHAATTDAARCLEDAAARLWARRTAGGRRRRTAVQAPRQHQRAGISRARLSARRAAQPPVPPGAHERCRRLAAAAGDAGAFSARTSRPGTGPIRGVAAHPLAEGDLAADVGRRDRRLAGHARMSTAFVELVRHNVVLPADAAPWMAVVRGELPPLGPDERRIVDAAGREFFAAAAEALDEAGPDLKRAHENIEGAYRAQGRRSVHAVARRAHRPGTRPGACAAAEVDAAGNGAPPTRVPCSKFIIH